MDLAKEIASMPLEGEAPAEEMVGEEMGSDFYEPLAEALVAALKDGNTSEVAEILRACLSR